MGLLSFIKDKIGDQFGVFDDVNDYVEFLERTAKETEQNAKVAQRVIADIEREIAAADTLEDLKSEKLRSLKSVLSGIKSDSASISRETAALLTKASKAPPEVKSKIESELRQAVRSSDQFASAVKDAEESVKQMESEQKAVLERLAQDPEEVAHGQRRMAISVGRSVGAFAALAAGATLILRLARLI